MIGVPRPRSETTPSAAACDGEKCCQAMLSYLAGLAARKAAGQDKSMNERDSGITTLAVGEEGPPTKRDGEQGITTLAVGEEGPPTEEPVTTAAVGEEDMSTMAVGEEQATTLAVGEEGAAVSPDRGSGNPFGHFG